MNIPYTFEALLEENKKLLTIVRMNLQKRCKNSSPEEIEQIVQIAVWYTWKYHKKCYDAGEKVKYPFGTSVSLYIRMLMAPGGLFKDVWHGEKLFLGGGAGKATINYSFPTIDFSVNDLELDFVDLTDDLDWFSKDLSEDEKKIIELRFGEEKTFKECGRALGRNPQWVFQQEKKILNKLKINAIKYRNFDRA